MFVLPQVLLTRYTGQDDIVVGVPVAGRDLPECQPLIGYFINPVAVRCQIDSTTSLADAVCYASGAMLSALANSQLPFQEVVREAGASWLPGINPIFQVS
jgi:non-ribosomal peptide synthetase component F